MPLIGVRQQYPDVSPPHAARQKRGRTTIEARVIDLDDPLPAEVEENEQRKEYTMALQEHLAVNLRLAVTENYSKS
jgi:hypothetical protein